MLFEAQWLRLAKRRLEIPGLPPALSGLKLLHISDLHAGAPGLNDKAIRKAIATAPRLEPDLILFTGDMVDKQKDLAPYLKPLASLKAPLGKFAVLGNHDHGLRKTAIQDTFNRITGRSRIEKTAVIPSEVETTVTRNRHLLDQAGIRLLENECITVVASGSRVQICGIDELQYGLADFDRVLNELDREAPLRILLSHAPEAAELIGSGDFQLVLAGHTHGGQICLPHPTRTKIPLSYSGSEFADGIHIFPTTIMHVSRGVGTTLVPLRLLSRPEITLLELFPEAD
jgi:predicted MPP superfamily phosphohydrolase